MACYVDLSQEVFIKKAITVPALTDKLNLSLLLSLIEQSLLLTVRRGQQLIDLSNFFH